MLTSRASTLRPRATVPATLLRTAANGRVIASIGAGALPFEVKWAGPTPPLAGLQILVVLKHSSSGTLVPLFATLPAANDETYLSPHCRPEGNRSTPPRRRGPVTLRLVRSNP